MRTTARAFGVLGLLFAVFVANGSAAAGDEKEPQYNGRSIKAWAADLQSGSKDDAEEAIRNLVNCRYVLGAPDVALPALIAQLKKKDGGRYAIAILVRLSAYGPLAAGAAEALKALDDEENPRGRILVSRIMIGSEPEECLKRLLKAMKTAKKGLGRKAGRRESYRLLNLLSAGGELGVRGEDVARFLLGMWPAKAPFRDDDLLQVGMDLGPAAGKLAPKVIKLLEHRDPVVRWRACRILASAPRLSAAHARRLVDAAPTTSSGSMQCMLLETAARHQPGPSRERLALFRAFRSADFEATRLWALAGLAPLAPDDELVQELKEALAKPSRLHDAAAYGLFALENPPPDLLPAWREALRDPDTRVRWRAAAALLAAGESPDALLPELVHGIDGPDDLERIEAFEAIARLGEVARPLADRLEAWAASPFDALAKPARKALASVR